MHNTILQRVKQFLNVKMVNLKKLTPIRRPAPAPHFHPLFKIFQISTLWGTIQNLLLPFKKGGSELCQQHVALLDLLNYAVICDIMFFLGSGETQDLKNCSNYLFSRGGGACPMWGKPENFHLQGGLPNEGGC